MSALSFNPWTLLTSMVFSGIGFVAFIYGKKEAAWRTMVLGITLMVFPYFIPNITLQCAVGVLLTAALYFFRD